MLEELRQIAEERGGDPEGMTLPDWRLHDLRRTTASGMARLGVGVHVVEKLQPRQRFDQRRRGSLQPALLRGRDAGGRAGVGELARRASR